jgi:hypothetical protein
MANSVYVLGGTNDVGAYYFYALRRDDDGNLFIRRDDVANGNDAPDIFGINKPEDFDGAFIDFDFDEGRNANHTLVYDAETEVKYEQWYWDDKLVSYYLNADGELILAVGKENSWNINADNITYNAGVTPTTFTLNLYGINSAVKAYDILTNAGWNQVHPVIIINHGTMRGVSTTVPALVIGGVYPYGITLINNGSIVGANGFAQSANISGDPSNAIEVNSDCNITNTGTISGGVSVTTASDGYAIVGISSVNLTNSGQIGSTI